MERVAKRSLITSLLAVFACALAVILAFVFAPAPVKAEGEETVVLSDAADFSISGGVLSGLSADGRAKIAGKETFEIVVPDTVTEIAEGALANTNGLTSLTLPFVGKSASATAKEGVLGYIFGKNAYLGGVVTGHIYDSVEYANNGNPEDELDTYNPSPNRVFSENYYIPYTLNTVTVKGGTLGHGAFSNCASVKSVTLQNISAVAPFAFYQSGVSTVDLGDVTVIDRRAFQGASFLRSIDLSKVTKIRRFAFAQSGLFEVDIPSSVGDKLGYYVFFNCEYLMRIKVNDGVVIPKGSIGYAFVSSNRIVEVVDLRTAADADKSVEYWRGQYNLFGSLVTVRTASSAKSNLINVNGYVFLPASNGAATLLAYTGTDKLLDLPDADDLAEYKIKSYSIASSCFSFNKQKFVTVQIPSCVTYIGSCFGNSGVIKITIGEYREDGNYPDIQYEFGSTFWSCPTIREVFIYSSYTYEDNGGYPLFGYTEYEYTDEGEWKYNHVFLDNVNCYNAAVDEIIPQTTIKTIGDYLFIKSGDSIELSYVGNGGVLSFPDRSQVQISYPESDGSYKIGTGILLGNGDVTRVNIPEAVTEIGEQAFKGAYRLINVDIEGNNLKKISQDAFRECSSLTSISIPDSVEHIGTYCFKDCISLSQVKLPASLKTWGTEKIVGGSGGRGQVFRNCQKLTSIVIPAGVSEVPPDAFLECSALSEITFAEGSVLTTIGSGAFNGNIVSSLTLPASVTEIKSFAFSQDAGAAPLKRLYIEPGSQLASLDGVFGSNCGLDSLHIANASDAIAFSQIRMNRGGTVYLPDNADVEQLVKFINNYGNDHMLYLVMSGQEAYNDLTTAIDEYVEQNSAARATSAIAGQADRIKNNLYWQTELTFTVTDKLGKTYTETQKKLACNSGADIKLVLSEDENGVPVGWSLDPDYKLPSRVGALLVNADDWQGVSLDTKLDGTSDITATMTDVDAVIALPSDRREQYTGAAYEFSDDNVVLDHYTDKDGKTVTAAEVVDVGVYYIYVTPIDGAVWENGKTDARAIRLEIEKATAELDWKYNSQTSIDSAAAYTLTYFDDLEVNLFTAVLADGSILRPGEGLTVIKDGASSGELSVMNVGLYRFTAAHKNYVFTNPDLLVRVNAKQIKLSENLSWQASNAAGAALGVNSGRVYIVSENDTVKHLHSMAHPNITYTEIRDVVNSIVRYTGKQTTITLAANPYYNINSITGNVQSESNIHTASVMLGTGGNYIFVADEQKYFTDRGITVVIAADGKTATVTKTWYLIELENELLDEEKSKAAANWVEYSIAGWTYGDDVTLRAPRLAHGDEPAGWANNTNVKFELRMKNDDGYSIIVSPFLRSQFAYYINSGMPVGDYELIADVSVVSLGNAHTHWWDGEEHNNTDSGLTALDFTRTYRFTVSPAAMSLNGDKLTSGDGGYADYTWEMIAGTDKELFLKDFADKVNADGAVVLVSVERKGYWATSSADGYYGDFTISYNLSRMNNEVYYDVTDNNLLGHISYDVPDTYKVYFRITAPNHSDLTDVGADGRYAYYFTVTVFKTIEAPAVLDGGLFYTGSRVLPTVDESPLYNIIWDGSADAYIAGGEHSVEFELADPVHYRWKDSDSNTVAVKFTVHKAQNSWIRDPNIVDWQFAAFDTQINRIRAVPQYLDAGQQVLFSIVGEDGSEIDGLSEFTVNNDGTVDDNNADLISALNGLRYGAYKLKVLVGGTENYVALSASVDFRIDKAINTWADGDDDLKLPGWVVGKYSEADNPIVVNAAHGKVNIVISDIDGNEYYNSITGVNKLNECEVGKYLLKAWVDETENYAALAERTFTIEVLDKIGLPWWGTLLITLGALMLAALIIFILWKKGVFQILTEKIVVAIRTRASVDATIAAVRAAKRMEEGKQSVADAKRRERIEQLRQKAKERRAMPPEERAAELEAKAQADEERAEKLRVRIENTRAKAAKMRGETIAAEASETEAQVEKAPAAEEPAVQAPVAESPAAEAPVEETPVAETPVAEPTVAETPTEEAPATEEQTPQTEAAATGKKRQPRKKKQ